MLAPRWWWPPRVRPLLEDRPRGANLPGQLYLKGMRKLPEYIGGFRRSMIEATSRTHVRFFAGEAGRFADLAGRQAELHATLLRICTVSLPGPQDYVAVHVRRGDFNERQRTSLGWFVSALRAARAAAGYAAPALVVSDAHAPELALLLQEPRTRLVRTGAPLGDLLVLASARVLLASGSSFSAWGAFLGGMPAVTEPAHSLAWYGVPGRSFLGHFHPEGENGAFRDAVADAF
jgi:hypothetical protein